MVLEAVDVKDLDLGGVPQIFVEILRFFILVYFALVFEVFDAPGNHFLAHFLAESSEVKEPLVGVVFQYSLHYILVAQDLLFVVTRSCYGVHHL